MLLKLTAVMRETALSRSSIYNRIASSKMLPKIVRR
jgi:predicted DNA-binding transcriptional regulator AlpA